MYYCYKSILISAFNFTNQKWFQKIAFLNDLSPLWHFPLITISASITCMTSVINCVPLALTVQMISCFLLVYLRSIYPQAHRCKKNNDNIQCQIALHHL